MNLHSAISIYHDSIPPRRLHIVYKHIVLAAWIHHFSGPWGLGERSGSSCEAALSFTTYIAAA